MPLTFKLNPESPDASLLKQAAAIVKKGGIIIYPTETVYGLGALYSNEEALKRVFAVKGRDELKPVLVLIREPAELHSLASDVSGQALALARNFWPGPLTLIFKAAAHLSPLLTGIDNTIGCRVSSSLAAQRLLDFLPEPLTSTSANLSGGINPSTIEEIPEELRNAVDVILDAGATHGGLPSTVIDVTRLPFTVVREGALPSQQVLSSR
ncbi:MAG: L-threonylcarbamoyladenylate synthase [Pseudomonadota bacterium]